MRADPDPSVKGKELKVKAQTKSTTILLVDDEKAYREAVTEVLHSRGYTVVQAGSAAEAVRVLEAVTPDLIMLDVMMPEIDGMTLLRQLASNPRFLSVPIIMASAKAQHSDRWAAWERGATAYLAKPFTYEEITTLVDRLLEPAPTDGADEVEIEMLDRIAQLL